MRTLLKQHILPFLNPFKRPIRKETLDAWAKIFEDGTKLAIFAIPVVLYGKEQLADKLFLMVSLIVGIYISIVISRLIREYSDYLSSPKGD